MTPVPLSLKAKRRSAWRSSGVDRTTRNKRGRDLSAGKLPSLVSLRTVTPGKPGGRSLVMHTLNHLRSSSIRSFGRTAEDSVAFLKITLQSVYESPRRGVFTERSMDVGGFSLVSVFIDSNVVDVSSCNDSVVVEFEGGEWAPDGPLMSAFGFAAFLTLFRLLLTRAETCCSPSLTAESNTLSEGSLLTRSLLTGKLTFDSKQSDAGSDNLPVSSTVS
ncbi:unnamed protein product [Dicrocoelium dendriticum]|nr:unnamed protein product [Dicrocoelium dendriticum]